MKVRTILIFGVFNSFVLVFFSSCNNNSEKNRISKIATLSDSLVKNRPDTSGSRRSREDILKLPSLVIDENYFKKKTEKAVLIDSQTLHGLNLDKVLSAQGLSTDPNSKFKIIDTLLVINQTKILVISRESENENWAWLARQDEAGKISDLVLIFYQDFVEYFSATGAKIEGNKISVTTQNDTDEDKSKQVKLYTLGSELDFKPAK